MQLEGTLAEELTSARRKVEAITDPAELIQFVTDWVECVEGMDEIRCPLFRLDRTITAALSVA